MKTKQELLDFYGVEIGKQYKITKVATGIEKSFEGEVFKVLENTERKDGLEVVFYTFGHPLAVLNFVDYEEVKPSILDDTEKRYLQKYVMDNPAFKGKVKFIQKNDNGGISKSYLAIYLNVNNSEIICLPYFTLGSMYKGMEENKRYTPKELCLEE